MKQNTDILVAKDLRKSYGARPALLGLSFSLKAGRVLGFLGPNGAGKTTAIRILTTILEPDSGDFTVSGIDSKHPERIRSKIGVLPESLGFPKNITTIEYLTYFGGLYGLTKTEARQRALSLIGEVGLGKRARSLIGTFSRGMRQRLGIARALINDPVVVFLDEPTLGLDPRGQVELLSLVERIARKRNAGVILCSHILSEIQGICDDVIILNFGQVVAQGTVTEVIERSQRNFIASSAVKIRVALSSVADARKVLASMPTISKVISNVETSDWLRIQLAKKAFRKSSTDLQTNNQILAALVRAKIPILAFEVEGGRLHDAFLNLTEETIK